MRHPHPLLSIAAVLALVIAPLGCQAQALSVAVTENSDTIPPYEVFELTFQHEGEYADPFFDVVIDATFTSPSGEGLEVGGFHYGSSEGADGQGEDRNGNGTLDHEEKDVDGDGYGTAHAVPWDAFPFDPNEWLDTDADGVGDNADLDDDNDGFPDKQETRAGTDPKDKLSFPTR